MPTRDEASQKWRLWVKQEVGGSPDRIEAVTQAAMVALDQGKGTDEIVNAARDAAGEWDAQHPQMPASANEGSGRWRRWVEQNIGGSRERIDRATQAALAAINEGKSADEIASEAWNSARAWDRQQHIAHPRRSRVWPMILLVITALLSMWMNRIEAPLLLANQRIGVGDIATALIGFVALRKLVTAIAVPRRPLGFMLAVFVLALTLLLVDQLRYSPVIARQESNLIAGVVLIDAVLLVVLALL